jgi:hypothetical protein
MRIAKPLLLVTTTLGLLIGVYEGWRLAGGLVLLLGAMVLGFGAATAVVVATIRREESTVRGGKP